MLLIERAGERVRRMIFQKRELRPPLTPPVFRLAQKLSADALILVLAPHCDLGYKAKNHCPVHRIQRLIGSRVYESDNLASEFRDKSDVLFTVGRMLVPFPVALRYRFSCRDEVEFRIKAGVILSTLEEDAGDAVSVFNNSLTNSCRDV